MFWLVGFLRGLLVLVFKMLLGDCSLKDLS